MSDLHNVQMKLISEDKFDVPSVIWFVFYCENISFLCVLMLFLIVDLLN